jgi:hypothetical protein
VENITESGSINPASITTNEMLVIFLSNMGFKSRPIPVESNILIGRDHEFTGQPQQYLFAEDNHDFQSHAIVSIEKNVLYIYYYQIENELFDIWEKFSGIGEVDKIHKSILSAATTKDISLRFHFFWPERIHTNESLASILAEIGFKSHETFWPDDLPSSGESSYASHRLILGSEHNLDTDAIVSVEQLIVHIYYRDRASGIFREYLKLSGEGDFSIFSIPVDPHGNEYKKIKLGRIKDSALHQAIINAMSGGKTER